MLTRTCALFVASSLCACMPDTEASAPENAPPQADPNEAIEQAAASAEQARALGRALFVHNWTANDELSHDGDGLGPVFNSSSCVVCHAQGGVGGAGGGHVNVNDIAREALFGVDRLTREEALARQQALGFGGLGTRGRSADGPRMSIPGPRNATALFGAGLLDSIPDAALEAAAQQKSRFRDVKGQLARTPEGRIGRFGWKADVPTLSEFVMRACAVEVGLEVPGASQRGVRPEGAPPPGLDLTLEDVEALTSFVSALPPPKRSEGGVAVRAGERIFEEIGCVACHREELGGVDGIYSDLLLHDMGPALADNGGAWGQVSQDVLARHWRTPPLWGVRDSAPYLHDGRVATLGDAISFHGGEAHNIALAYNALPESKRLALIAFLESLVAPDA